MTRSRFDMLLTFLWLLLLLSSSSSFHQKINDYKKAKSSLDSQFQSQFLEEKLFNSKQVLQYIDLSNSKVNVVVHKKNNFKLSFSFISQALKSIFLPDGFPNSVPKEYATFQFWNLIQDWCSYLRGILSTRAILEGFGVGRSDITSIQAAVQWIYRDGASMLGGLLFTTFTSANFGQNVKSWRLFADLINNVGITLDMLAPIYREHFLVLVCIASLCKSLCGIAAGATGGQIAAHWGINGNIADVLAKNGAQHTLLSLIGLSMSVPFAKYANAKTSRLFMIYGILTIIHIYSNVKAMKALALRSLNISRYKLLASQLISLKSIQCAIEKSFKSRDTTVLNELIISNMEELQLFSLESIASKEPLLSLIIPSILRFDITLKQLFTKFQKFIMKSKYISNSRLSDISINLWSLPSKLLKNMNFDQSEISHALSYYSDDTYSIICQLEGNKILNHLTVEPSIPSTVYICYREDCSGYDQAKAIFEAVVICYLCELRRTQLSNCHDCYISDSFALLDSSKQLSNQIFPIFWKQLSKYGWDTDRVLLTIKNPKVYQYTSSFKLNQ